MNIPVTGTQQWAGAATESFARRHRTGGGLRWALLAVPLWFHGTSVAIAADPGQSVTAQTALDQSSCDQPSPAPPSAPGGTLAPFSRLTFTRGKNSSGWLPFEYFAKNRVFVPIELNGHAVAAMLDSGASETVIDTRFARSVGLSPKGSLTGQGDGGSATYATVRGVDIRLDDAHWRGDTAVVIDLTAVARQVGHAVSVILGGGIFKNSVVDLDFGGRRIALRNPVSYAPPVDAQEVLLMAAGENRAISAVVEGRPARLLFDLGNAGAIDLYPRFWEQSAFKRRKTSTAYVGGVGGMSVQKTAMLGDVSLGGARFLGVPARLQDARSSSDARCGKLDGNIGIGILIRFRLIVDFPGNKVLFARPIDAATPFRVNHAGLTLRPGDGGATVLHVAADSPADHAGLKADAVIDRVDGQLLSAGKDSDWQYGPIGKVVRLHLTTGEEKTVILAQYF